MPYGLTLKMRSIKVPPPEQVSRGNPDHHHPIGRPVRVHKVDRTVGDRARYRATVRTARLQALAKKVADREAAGTLR